MCMQKSDEVVIPKIKREIEQYAGLIFGGSSPDGNWEPDARCCGTDRIVYVGRAFFGYPGDVDR